MHPVLLKNVHDSKLHGTGLVAVARGRQQTLHAIPCQRVYQVINNNSDKLTSWTNIFTVTVVMSSSSKFSLATLPELSLQQS